MSNSILPHLLSDSPPPLVADDEEFEDEFGDFKGSEELSFDNENPSTPSSLKNSNDYFPDTYSDFNICNIEGRHQIIETPEDKSTTNIINSIPSSNYFTLWEQLENNIPEIIDKDEDLQNAKGTVDIIEKSQEINENSTYQSNENLNNLNYQNGNDLEYELPPTCTEKCSEEVKSIELPDTFKEKEIEVKLQNDDIPSISNSGYQDELESNIENYNNDFTPIENNIESEVETEKCCDSYCEESGEEKTKIGDCHISESTSDSIHTDNSFIYLQTPVSDELKNVEESAREKSDILEEVKASENLAVAENRESEDDFGEFADFSSSKINDIPILETKLNPVKNDDDDDFYEFERCEISCVTKNDIESSKPSVVTQEHTVSRQSVDIKVIDEDSFDDFSSYSKHDENITEESSDCGSHTLDEGLKICRTPEEALRETQNVLEKIFSINECNTTPEYSNCDYLLNNSVFENLKDITETNALTYQWCKSVAQKNILRTLNIDIRNILYGPTWNSGMPIFAPNLCSKPLEPIKSELPIPISPLKIVESQESTTSAMSQFDWSGSGLTDLQDSSVNIDKEFTTNLQGTSEEFETIQPTYIDPVPITPKLNHLEEESSQSRQLEIKLEECHDINDDFSDFTSYQGNTEKETKWKNMLPLRESHISSNSQQDDLEMDKISIYFQELTTGKSEAVGIDQSRRNPKISSNDTSLKLFENERFSVESPPVFDNLQKIKANTKIEELVPPNNPVKNDVSYVETDLSNYCDMWVDNFSSNKTEEIQQIKEDIIPDQSSVKHQEDEFTDFQSSLPCTSRPSIQPALLEPLKPAVLQAQPVKDRPVKIEWPEPGLDEAEINRIVNGVLRKNSTSENVMEVTKNVEQTENDLIKSVPKNDHDDWSDFISVKEPLKSRTSTPDLPLSVFNLGSIQPSKVSAPFVSPNGVVHSPSKTLNIGLPVVNRNLQNGTQQSSHRQPFITSQAFNALYSNTKNNLLQPNTSGKTADIKQSVTQFSCENKMSIGSNRLEQNIGLFSQSGTLDKNQHASSSTYSNAEDDDWGDFVSAPNTISHSNSSANFFQPLSYMKTNLGFSSKTAPSQKFSTAPKNTVVKQERNNFPVISTMPDLDFVSPKSRSTIK